MGTSQVVVVRHAQPVIDPARPAGTWVLDPAAMGAIGDLTAAMRHLGIDGIVTSPEPKADATARGIAAALGAPVEVDERLREQGLDAVPWMGDGAFLAAVEAHFRAPDDMVLGAESSAAAADRAGAAIEEALARFRRPAIVTHGRLMAAWFARVAGVDAVPFWQQLRMPDAYVVDREARRCWRVGERGNG